MEMLRRDRVRRGGHGSSTGIRELTSDNTTGRTRGRLRSFCFFFQAEDGIRDLTVTGVQTCALPISHLDPDVLIVDEVLAVGDAVFQKKCVSAMHDLRGGGRTVLFVSHNMAAVENLCSRGMWIAEGRVRLDGPMREVIEAYMGSFASADSASRALIAEIGRASCRE